MGALRYLLLNVRGAAQFLAFDDEPPDLLERGGDRSHGADRNFGRRASEVDEPFRNENRQSRRRPPDAGGSVGLGRQFCHDAAIDYHASAVASFDQQLRRFRKRQDIA
jgi:hypothetical protein